MRKVITARECGSTGDPGSEVPEKTVLRDVIVVVDSVDTNKLIKRDNKSLVFMCVDNGKEGSAFGVVLHEYTNAFGGTLLPGPPLARGEVAV